MNLKGGLVVGGIIAIILLVVLLPTKGGEIPPRIIDQTDIIDEASIGREAILEDIPTITDYTDIENEPGSEFYIDENGTKHYILDVRDAPQFEG